MPADSTYALVRGILNGWYGRHRFYRDTSNDAAVLDTIAGEICRAVADHSTPQGQAFCTTCGRTFTGPLHQCSAWLESHRHDHC